MPYFSKWHHNEISIFQGFIVWHYVIPQNMSIFCVKLRIGDWEISEYLWSKVYERWYFQESYGVK